MNPVAVIARAVSFVVMAWLVAGSNANALAQAAGTAKPWPHEQPGSDLPVDPRIHFGKTPAGFRYAWVHQPSQTEKTVHLRLRVDIGSLVEQESELGMAHFVEHMAFNGTKGFKAGTLVEWFENHGVRFGRDQNAHTSTTETAYELDLADADPERLEKSLAWLRDVADGLLFEEKEVTAEKGVIDAEERERDGPDLRLYVQIQKQLIDGTRVPTRLPIGKKAARAKFSSASCRAFYSRWYRPERMTLLIVGNLPDVDVEALVQKAFGSLATPKDPIAPVPEIGTVTPTAKAFCTFDPESKGVQLFAAKARAASRRPDTAAERRSRLLRNAAFGLMNQRLAKAAQRSGGVLLGASFGDWNFEELLQGPALRIACTKEKWAEALGLAAAELRRTLAEGFTREEHQATFRELSEYCALEPAAEQLPMGEYLGELLAAAEGRRIPVDELAERRLLQPAVKELSADRLKRELVDAWSEGELYLFSTGALDLGADAAAKLRATWDATPPVAAAGGGEIDAPGAAPTDDEPVDFFYKARGATGKLAGQSNDEALQIIQFEFENGVHVVLRPSVQGNQGAAIAVRVGDGYLALDPAESSVGWVAGRIFLLSGLGEHTFEQLQKSLKGRQLAFNFSIQLDGLFFTGSAAPDDFQRLCEIVCAYLKDPGWRADAFDQFMRDVPRLYDQMEQGFAAPLSQFEGALHGNDARFMTPDRALVESFLLDTVKEFVQPQLDEGPIEIAVVGGMDPNAIANILARTFALLPKRGEAADRSANLASPPVAAGLKFRREIDSAQKKARVAIAFPTGDGVDAARRHELQFLASVFDDRVRREIREKKGAAYSPQVRPDLNELLPGVGCIRVDVECDPSKADEVTNACLAIADALAKKGIGKAEFDQVRTIALAEVDKLLARDDFWLSALARAASRPESLAQLKSAKANVEAVTIEAVNALAKQHLPRAKASIAVIAPKKQTPKKS